MNQITQYRPEFFTGFPDPLTVEFGSVEELRAIPFVAGFRHHAAFYQYCICQMRPDRLALMAEYDSGAHWWVVGFLKEPVDLPVWDAKAARQRKSEGSGDGEAK